MLPSRQENFGLVVTEAMARATPVVVSDRAFACEHLAAADAGIVVPLEVGALGVALDRTLSDPVVARLAGERGRAYVITKLGWQGIAKQMRAMYQSCL